MQRIEHEETTSCYGSWSHVCICCKTPLTHSIAFVIHGGAGNITADRFTPEQQAEYHAGLQKAPSCW